MVNLLELALPILTNVVPPCEFEYRTYSKDEIDEMGVVKVRYSGWKKCVGSVQPMQSSMIQLLDLDKSKRSILVWGSVNLNTLDIQDHPDQVRWQGRIFNCVQATDWMQANGWHSIACTEVKTERPENR